MGLCFVTEKGFDEILKIKDDVIKSLKQYPTVKTTDIQWATIFVKYITYENKEIDLRLQKGQLDEIQ